MKEEKLSMTFRRLPLWERKLSRIPALFGVARREFLRNEKPTQKQRMGYAATVKRIEGMKASFEAAIEKCATDRIAYDAKHKSNGSGIYLVSEWIHANNQKKGWRRVPSRGEPTEKRGQNDDLRSLDSEDS